jgi:SAM-dependent methyltransferase
MATKESIVSFWDKAAEANPYWYVSSYGPYKADRDLDAFFASGHTIWRDIKQIAGYAPASDHSVVEIGCGVGRLTRAIAPEVGRCVCLDISERMLTLARGANLSNVEFQKAEGFTLPGIRDKSVDLALAYCVFQHLPSHDALRSYLDEMCRVVKPRGLVAFTLPPRNWTTYLLPALRIRAYLREHFGGGPVGIYRKEWVGIRPAASTVARLSAIPLRRTAIDNGRILFFGRH